MWEITDSNVGHDSLICWTCLIHMCVMTHSYVAYHSFTRGTWLNYMWDMAPSDEGHDSIICGTCLLHTCDMTQLCVENASIGCGTWLIHTCDNPVSYVRHKRGTWLIHMCDRPLSYVRHERWTWTREMPHSCVGHDSIIFGIWLIHTWDVTQLYLGYAFINRGTWCIHMGWPRLVGSLKL